MAKVRTTPAGMTEGATLRTEETGNGAGHTHCKRCNGSGVIPDPPVWRANQGPRTARRCPDCKGTGHG